MIEKITKEINDFTNSIKNDGFEKMENYVNSSIYSCIKILMFASKTFSIFTRILIFFIISIGGLLMLSAIGAMGFNPIFLILVFLCLLIFTLVYVTYFKKVLNLKLKESKKVKS